jgi:hypothetical protein
MAEKKRLVKGTCTGYFVTASSPKLKQRMNVKESIATTEVEERNGLKRQEENSPVNSPCFSRR